MTTSTTPISLAGTASPVSVAQELGLGLTTQISLNDSAVRTLAGVGGAGTISDMNSLRNKSDRTVVNVNVGTTANYNVNSTGMIPGYRAGKTDVTFTVTSGSVVYATSTGTPAFWLQNIFTAGDTVTINIQSGAYISGMGGTGGAAGTSFGGGFSAAGNGGNGTNGGPALRVDRAGTSVVNNGAIYGGGGGGAGSACGYDPGTPAYWVMGTSGGGGACYYGNNGGPAVQANGVYWAAPGYPGTLGAGGNQGGASNIGLTGPGGNGYPTIALGGSGGGPGADGGSASIPNGAYNLGGNTHGSPGTKGAYIVNNGNVSWSGSGSTAGAIS